MEESAAERNALPTTSLILCSRNRPQFVSEALAAVLAGADVPSEIIIVDQSDTVHEMPFQAVQSGIRVRYLWRPGRGLSLARNTGIAASRGKVLAFLDDDVLVGSEWFGTLVRALVAAGPRTVVTGRVLSGEPERPGAFAPSLSVGEHVVVHEGRPGRDVLLPMNMAMYRSALGVVGLFDERLGVGSGFPSSEDNDLGLRLLEAGFRILHDPDVVVIHRAWRSPQALLPLRWAYGRGQGAYYAKHASLRDRYMVQRLAWDVGRHLRRAPRRARDDPRSGIADVVYSAAVLTGAAQWLLRRPPP